MTFWERVIERSARFLRVPWLHAHAQDRYLRGLQDHVSPGVRWLDLGCGHQIVPDWAATKDAQMAIAARARCLVGVDVDIPAMKSNPFVRHRVIALGDNLPFAGGTFDLVSANMVVEHFQNPGPIFTEILRVLVPGGKFLFHTPNRLYFYTLVASLIPDAIKLKFIWWLERRAEGDVFKTYYRANTLKRIRALAAHTNFEIVKLSIGGSVGALGLLGPIGLLELPFLKLLTFKRFNRFNATIIGILRKPCGDGFSSVLPAGRRPSH